MIVRQFNQIMSPLSNPRHRHGEAVDAVFQTIRHGIISGRFAPGQRLVIRDLAEEIPYSRSTFREALRRLAAERLVSLIPNRGAAVQRLTPREMADLFEIRELLEGQAARRAAERIRARMAELRGREEDVELLYRLPDPWERKLFLALCCRYGLKPFGEYGRRYSTVQLRAPESFQDRTLWPKFLELSKELHVHPEELTEQVIREAINDDVSEAVEGGPPKELPVSNQR